MNSADRDGCATQCTGLTVLPTDSDVNASDGFCPIKSEFRRPAPARVSLDELGRTRGLNRGSERALCQNVPGTQSPTLQGELNFFHSETLQRVKLITRRNPRKRSCPDTSSCVDIHGSGDGEHASSNKQSINKSSVAVTRISSHDVPCGDHDQSRSLFKNKLVLAPLTTVGNLPFRRICKRFGADVTMSEMAVVYNLNRLQKSEWALLRRHRDEDLFGIQLAVSHANEARTIAQALSASEFEYDFIDINCGCPVDAIVRYGCGCALGERKGRLRDVVREMTEHQSRPVSIKCRIGPDDRIPVLHKQIAEFAGWGASSVTVHGRSRKQRYTKLANWDYINECSALTSLPVVGNGDILSWEDAELHRRKHSCISSLMIGRGALIKPWIFEEIKNSSTKDVSSGERLQILKDFCSYGLDHWGSDKRGIMTTRRFLCEWLSFFHRYVPVALMEQLPQRINDRPPYYVGRDDLETLMASDSVVDWVKISEMLLGPAEQEFHFVPKHRSNSYTDASHNNNAVAGEDNNIEG